MVLLLWNGFASIALKLFGNFPMIIADFEEMVAKWSNGRYGQAMPRGQVGPWASCGEC